MSSFLGTTTHFMPQKVHWGNVTSIPTIPCTEDEHGSLAQSNSNPSNFTDVQDSFADEQKLKVALTRICHELEALVMDK